MIHGRFLYITVVLILCSWTFAQARHVEYGAQICHQPQYRCLKVKRSDSWSQLFPDPKQCDMVKRINRTNDFLEEGMILAVPKEWENKTIFDFSPFPLVISPSVGKLIMIDLNQLAFGAYSRSGQLVRWGPISAGTDNCLEFDKGCSTPKGVFFIRSKKGKDCFSKTLPLTVSGESGGASMPYCMHFYQGYALHGSQSLPGYHASHGCVRLFVEDSRWLNEHFVEVSNKHQLGTKVLIK